MTNHPTGSLYVKVTKQFLDALRNGATPWIKPWSEDNPHPSLPVNAVTGRTYSGVNVTILWSTSVARGYSKDRWLTFRQSSSVGGRISKGQKGTVAILFRDIEVKSNNKHCSAKDCEDESERRTIKLIRGYTLFNVEQCENLPKYIVEGTPPDPSLPKWDAHKEAEIFIKKTGALIHHNSDQAVYIPKKDLIRMPALSEFSSTAGYYSTLFHELTHWTGHKNRLNRPGIMARNKLSPELYAFEELVAEIGSAFICAKLNIPGDLRHEGYVLSWIKVLENNPRAIFQASALAWQASKYLQNG